MRLVWHADRRYLLLEHPILSSFDGSHLRLLTILSLSLGLYDTWLLDFGDFPKNNVTWKFESLLFTCCNTINFHCLFFQALFLIYMYRGKPQCLTKLKISGLGLGNLWLPTSYVNNIQAHGFKQNCSKRGFTFWLSHTSRYIS